MCVFFILRKQLVKITLSPDVLIIFAYFGRINLIKRENLTLKKHLTVTGNICLEILKI